MSQLYAINRHLKAADIKTNEGDFYVLTKSKYPIPNTEEQYTKIHLVKIETLVREREIVCSSRKYLVVEDFGDVVIVYLPSWVTIQDGIVFKNGTETIIVRPKAKIEKYALPFLGKFDGETKWLVPTINYARSEVLAQYYHKGEYGSFWISWNKIKKLLSQANPVEAINKVVMQHVKGKRKS